MSGGGKCPTFELRSGRLDTATLRATNATRPARRKLAIEGDRGGSRRPTAPIIARPERQVIVDMYRTELPTTTTICVDISTIGLAACAVGR